jgi:hypothetical protein
MNNDLNKLLSVVCHLAALFTSFLAALLVPIVILAVSEDDVVKANAREALNFQLNMLLWALLALLLVFVGIGVVLLIVLAIWCIIAPIIAMINVASTPEVPYRYPLLIVRFV